MIWCTKTYTTAYVKIQQNEDILSIMSNLQPNSCLKVDFQKVDQRAGASGWSTTPSAARTISCKAWNSPAEYSSWVARCDIKGSDGTMLKPIFWKEVQGQKHSGRWEIAEHPLPSIKVCFIQITKITSILVLDYLSESKTQLVNQRKVAFNPRTAHSPEIQSYRMWWGAASPILNDTPVVCIYTSFNRTYIKNAYIYFETEFLDGNKGLQIRTHTDTHTHINIYNCNFYGTFTPILMTIYIHFVVYVISSNLYKYDHI